MNIHLDPWRAGTQRDFRAVDSYIPSLMVYLFQRLNRIEEQGVEVVILTQGTIHVNHARVKAVGDLMGRLQGAFPQFDYVDVLADLAYLKTHDRMKFEALFELDPVQRHMSPLGNGFVAMKVNQQLFHASIK